MKKLLKSFFVFLGIVCFFSLIYFFSYFGSINNISNDENVVFLTFDDGPSENTQKVLEILEKKEVLATFFLIGDNFNISNEILNNINYSNHSIGIHSMSHPRLFFNFDYELKNSKLIIDNYFNKNISLFRPPYGFSNPILNYKISKNNLDFIMWDVFPKDYEKNSDEILENIDRNLKSGSIIVLHDTTGNREEMISILPEIIDSVRGNGFKFGLIENYLD